MNTSTLVIIVLSAICGIQFLILYYMIFQKNDVSEIMTKNNELSRKESIIKDKIKKHNHNLKVIDNAMQKIKDKNEKVNPDTVIKNLRELIL